MDQIVPTRPKASVVPCLTPELQLEHHGGYAPRDQDRMDMARLASRFGLSLREPY
jgi:hypothetical protein